MELSYIEVLVGLAVFGITSAAGAVLTGVVLIRLPADYFSAPRPPKFWLGSHPVLRVISLILKNIAGGLLVALGVVLAMPGVPGPGILTILLGITLMDFPGKRRLERWIMSRRKLLDAVNRLRRRYGRPPLVL